MTTILTPETKEISAGDSIEESKETLKYVVENITDWDELELSSELLKGIYSCGYEKPSPIQQLAIKPMILKHDIIAQAQSGTGKTATFTIGALANVVIQDNNVQVLVLSPTKELTIQTTKVFESIGGMMKGLNISSAYGGSYYESNSFLNKNIPHVICGCPGRILDMLRHNKINGETIKLVILDEADEMLSSGFKEQIYNIFQFFNNKINVALFSATIPEEMYTITNMMMQNPVKVTVKKDMLTLEGIQQFYVAVENDRQKYLTLKDIYSYLSLSQCIIYCNSVKRVEDLYEAMREDEFPVCRIHSNMDKIQREISFNEFKNGKSRVLISSDVTSRGIDIQQVSTVINFDLPKCVHTYLHRIGRSGRWGRKGVGINFITRKDLQKMREIEQHYSTQINELPNDLNILSKT